jgi:hypothetical protein
MDEEKGYWNYADELGWDLAGCLRYNPQSFTLEQVERVLAVIEGEPDGPDYHWILLLKDGRHAYLTGGCDYTGWDCQSSATSEIFDAAVDACLAAPRLDQDEGRGNIGAKLWKQVLDGRDETKREQVGRQLSE